MVRFMKQAAATALLATAMSGSGYALPTSIMQMIQRRGGAGDVAQLVSLILGGFKKAFPEVHNAWDFKANGQMCAVYMETRDGANCKASVECQDGKRDYNAWNVCYVGGRQYFTDDRIGDFSITFTERDGAQQGQGLTTPVLQLADIGNWQEIPVVPLALETKKNTGCKESGLSCYHDEPFVCVFDERGNSYIQDDRTKRYLCGVPKVGQGFLNFDSNGPENDRGYAGGWCGIHVTQYQKPNPATDTYGLDVHVFDSNQKEIGWSGRVGPTASIWSPLPWTVELQTQAWDTDPVKFQYADQSWDSNSAQCKVGAYDSGSRQMDCGFSC